MHQQTIRLSRPLADVRVRAKSHGSERPADNVISEQDAQSAKEQLQRMQTQRLQQTLDAIQEAVQESEQRRQQSLNELQKIAVELALMAAEHVVFRELQHDSLGVEQLIMAAIARIGLPCAATLQLHPEDLALLRNQLGSRAVPWNEQLLTLTADAGVERGGVRLESAAGRIVFSDVATRLADIRQEWMEKVNDTQDADRRVSQDSQSLRRFPDRRETA